MEDQHRIRACFGEQALALVERGEAEGRQVRLEETHRMRIERCDQGRAGFGARAIDRRADHRLVPAMKSVEIAERGHPAAKMCRNRRAAVQPTHVVAVRTLYRFTHCSNIRQRWNPTTLQ